MLRRSWPAATAALLLVTILTLSPASAVAADADLSTPLSAAKAFTTALANGDAAGAKAAAIADEKQQRALDTMAMFIGSFKKVQDAAVDKFGEAGKQVTSDKGISLTDQLQKLDTAKVTTEGDTATLTVENDPNPLHLKKVDGVWKVDMATVPGTAEVEQAIPILTTLSTSISEVANEISAGKYNSIEEAKTALQQQMMSAMTGAAPSTQPATSATTKPGL